MKLYLVSKLNIFRGCGSTYCDCINNCGLQEIKTLFSAYCIHVIIVYLWLQWNLWILHVSVCSEPVFLSAQVAVKFVSKKMQKKEQVAHEADVLLHVQNPQLVALLDTYESPSSLMLVLELWVWGELLVVLKLNKSEWLHSGFVLLKWFYFIYI